MREWQSQAHVRWYCRYHVVIVPKYRLKSMYGAIRREIGGILKEQCRRHGIELVEGHVMADHVHMCLSIPPKYSVAHAVGRLKGKSAIQVNQRYSRRKNVMGFKFWSRGYCVSTVGLEESVIRAYIRDQEERDKHEDQMMITY